MAEEVEETDPFIDMCGYTRSGLQSAVLECGWIAEGGGTASIADRAMAAVRKTEYQRAKTRVGDHLLAYLADDLNVTPPTKTDLDRAERLATRLAEMESTNVKVTTIVGAATDLLNLFAKSGADLTA
jgi:hypothetical protein